MASAAAPPSRANRPAAARFTQKDIRRAFNSVKGLGFEEVRVAIAIDGAIEVTARVVATDNIMGQDLD